MQISVYEKQVLHDVGRKQECRLFRDSFQRSLDVELFI